jgi:hypothetical protein
MTSRTGYLVSACLLLILFAWLGVRSSLALAGADHSTGVRAIQMLQWWYVVLAALAIVGLLLRHNGTRLVLFAWAAIFTTRTALVPVFLGGKGIGLAVAGGAIGLAISIGVLFLASRALQPPSESPAT